MARRKRPAAWSAAQVVQAIEQAPFFLAAQGPDGRQVYVNRAAYGHEHEALVGIDAAELVVGEDRDRWRAAVAQATDLGQTPRLAVRCVAPNGMAPPKLVCRLWPVRQGGEVVGAMVMARDVSLEDEGADGVMGLLLGPLERKVVRCLLEGPALRGGAIGRAVGESSGKQASARLRLVLAGLRDRGVLTHGPKGYQVSAEFLPHARRACDGL